jgi:mannose-6-phosphate isomerase-like protein (cupin superfamily)
MAWKFCYIILNVSQINLPAEEETPMKTHTHYSDAEAFITRDGSTIRELMHPDHHAVRAQSFAEAIVAAGATTELHLHRRTEEIYHITQGTGRMRLGAKWFDVGAGDTIVIKPATPHCITNIGNDELKILCASSPAYSHEDTDLL